MLSRLVIALLAAQVLFLVGCSYLKYPNIHKVAILQGNILNQKMVDQLRPGLTRSQVRYILGTPLIANTFDQSRWDYFYSVKRAGYDEIREHISIYFVDDKLSYFTGDYVPTSVSTAIAAKQSGQASDVVEPPGSGNPKAFSVDAASLKSESLDSGTTDSQSASSPTNGTTDIAADKADVEPETPDPAPIPESPWEDD